MRHETSGRAAVADNDLETFEAAAGPLNIDRLNIATIWQSLLKAVLSLLFTTPAPSTSMVD